MSPVEDRLYAAARALAEVMPDGSPPPRWITTPDGTASRQSPRRWVRPWLVPLAAAVAVVAAVVVSLAITSDWDHRHATSPAAQKRAPQDLSQGLPPYYVAISSARWHAVAISSTATGRSLADVSLGQTWFPETAGTGGNDHTFVLAARTSNLHGPGRFFLLRFDADGDRATLTPLAVSIPAGLTPEALAISPDGNRLAVAYPQGADQMLTVFDLGTGAERTWAGRSLALGQAGSLSWSANSRTVQYAMYDNGPPAGQMVYGLLNTAAPAGPLPVRTIPVSSEYISTAIISANGTLVVTGTRSAGNPGNGTWQLRSFVAATGHPIGGPVTLAGQPYAFGWVSPDGDLLLKDDHGLYLMGARLSLRLDGRHLLSLETGQASW
jgi:hypothetical protein